MTLPVQRKLVCAQVQLADLLITLMSEAEEEEQAERDRWQGLSSVDKVIKSTQCDKLIVHTLSLHQYIDDFPQDISMVQNQWKQTSQYVTSFSIL